jgi:3-oxoacyl-[acyl-carrier-protein] synthase III
VARHATVIGVGSSLPERAVPNSWFEERLQTTDEWIRERTGIRSRRFADPSVATSDLGLEASRRALETAGIAPEQVDLIVCATLSPDTPIPSTAVWIQRKLGISCPAFDVNAACAGFSYAMSTAVAFVESGAAETVLVIGAEVLSKVLDMDDRGTSILFGDGAGALVIRPGERQGVIGSVLGADGTAAEILLIPAGGTQMPASQETVARHDHAIRMPNGREVFKRAVMEMASSCRELLEKSGYTPDDVNVLIPHQANARIMNAVAERLGITGDRAIVDVEEIGNTSAASIPIALAEAADDGRLSDGDLVLSCGFGAGMTWSSAVLRWGRPVGAA